jgi:TRAP-type C4-dicarboxylate transport system permease small subunit
MHPRLDSGLRLMWRVLDWLTAAMMVAMIGIVFGNVVLRYGFSSGLRETVELSRLAFVWIVMLGSVSVLRRGDHLGMPEIAHRYFPKALPLLDRLSWLVVLVSSVMLLWGSLRITVANWHNISQLTGLPAGLFYLAGVVSGALMAAIAVARILSPQPVDAARSQGDIA